MCAKTDGETHSESFPPKVNGAKTLVLDNSIAGPLGLVTDVSLLKVSKSPSPPLAVRLCWPDIC